MKIFLSRLSHGDHSLSKQWWTEFSIRTDSLCRLHRSTQWTWLAGRVTEYTESNDVLRSSNRSDHSRTMDDWVSRVPVYHKNVSGSRHDDDFSLLAWISFYVSSRRTQTMCPDRENSTDFARWTSLGRCFHCASNDKFNFSMEQIDGSISSFESTRSWVVRTGNRTRWIWCRFPITNRIDHSRTMEDFVSWPGRVTSKKVDHDVVTLSWPTPRSNRIYLKTWSLFDQTQRRSVSLPLSLSKLPSIFVGINQAMSRWEWWPHPRVMIHSWRERRGRKEWSIRTANLIDRTDCQEKMDENKHIFHRSNQSTLKAVKNRYLRTTAESEAYCSDLTNRISFMSRPRWVRICVNEDGATILSPSTDYETCRVEQNFRSRVVTLIVSNKDQLRRW